MIINAPLAFPPEVAITPECKELLKNMLDKNPDSRISLLDLMSKPYYTMT
jgi:serine/threonine protein kinase